MRKQAKQALALALCVMMFTALLSTQAFAAGKASDAFFKWYTKAQQDYTESVVKQPKTFEDYRRNSDLKYAFLVDFNSHKNAAMGEIATEALAIDKETFDLLAIEQKIKKLEAEQLAADYKAAADKAVLETTMARDAAWQASVDGTLSADAAYQQYLDNGAQAVKIAQDTIEQAQNDYADAIKAIDEENERIRKEREKKLKELMEELERLRAAQAATVG